MPSHEEHCRQSFERYGKRFDELHAWMDEPSAIMGSRHRMYRHDPYRTPKEALERFGPMADHACLDHIKLDRHIKTQIIQIFRKKKHSLLIATVLGVMFFIFFIGGFAVASTPVYERVYYSNNYSGYYDMPTYPYSILGSMLVAFSFFLGVAALVLPRKDVIKTVEASLTYEDTDVVLCPYCNSRINIEEQEACRRCGLALTYCASLYKKGYRW